jgi:hypothetical protein
MSWTPFIDEEALRGFIAKELTIPFEEVEAPQTYFIGHQGNYVVGEDFIAWTLSLRE